MGEIARNAQVLGHDALNVRAVRSIRTGNEVDPVALRYEFHVAGNVVHPLRSARFRLQRGIGGVYGLVTQRAEVVRGGVKRFGEVLAGLAGGRVGDGARNVNFHRLVCFEDGTLCAASQEGNPTAPAKTERCALLRGRGRNRTAKGERDLTKSENHNSNDRSLSPSG